MRQRIVFLSGGTGYLGRPLAELLVERGHSVRVLARKGSERKVAPGALAVPGNACDAGTFSHGVTGSDTFIHLTGTPRPAPWKENEFRAIDLRSLHASAQAAQANGISHFIYVSVAQPAPVMRAYIAVRQECEQILAGTRMPATLLRPWYVLGPGHWWPWLLQPAYALARQIPATREAALRLGLVTLGEMVRTLSWTVDHSPTALRIMDVPEIRRIGAASRSAQREDAAE